MITKQENVAPGFFYWLVYNGEEVIGKAIKWHDEILFEITGYPDKISFDRVSEITSVCLFKH